MIVLGFSNCLHLGFEKLVQRLEVVTSKQIYFSLISSIIGILVPSPKMNRNE